MAFVILSAGTLTRSKTRTISAGFFVGLVAAGMLVTLLGGFALGYGLRDGSHDPAAGVGEGGLVSRLANEVEAAAATVVAIGTATVDYGTAESFEPAPVHVPGIIAVEGGGDGEDGGAPENRMLIDRFGELSGRMIQLEVEAAQLAARIGAIQEFEARLKTDSESKKKSRQARTPPARSSGGPLLRPVEADRLAAEAQELVTRILDHAEDRPAFAASDSPDSADHLESELVRMEDGITRLADALSELDRIATSLNLVHMSFPGRAPVKGVQVGSRFGNRVDPFTKRRAFHSGIDFAAPRGTPILASAGGRVIYAAFRKDYGHTVEIDHGAGLVTRYAHASKLLVKVGQVVMPGEKIALIGSTGRSSGPHLHFEILQDGRYVDPTTYLARF